MLGEGARRVVGIDPNNLFLLQFQAIKKYCGPDAPIDLLPIKAEDLAPNLECFDTTFSMGVLYHRRSPIDHLYELKDTLRAGGELVLETLVVDGQKGYSLVPEDRYAMMRNVWFLPSIPTMEQWLERVGFRDVRCVENNVTSTEEQHSTEWMQFKSLADFLDPKEPTRTLEGYPAPRRATFVALK
jgi:tRNA (mo5U34)-methyltransferase